MNNYQLSEKLSEMAVMCEYCGENVFRARAFARASEILASFEPELYELDGAFSIDGIGRGVREVIDEFLAGGRSSAYDELKRKVPEDIFAMLSIAGIGVKKLRTLCDALGIGKLDELLEKARNGEVRLVKGFSAAGEAGIISEIARIKSDRHSKLFFAAERLFIETERELRRLDGIAAVAPAGELARKLPVVGRLSCTVLYVPGRSCGEAAELIAGALNIASRDLKIFGGIGHLRVADFSSGFPAEFFLVEDGRKAAAVKNLLAFSREYLEDAAGRSGVLKGVTEEDAAGRMLLAVSNMAETPAGLDVMEMAPEHSELAWKNFRPDALRGMKLFTTDRIKGVFHVHSNYSDGADPLETIAIKAKEMGLAYAGITDHSKSSAYAGGLSAERLAVQCAQIDELNEKYYPFKIFKGVECDILKDGSLDFPDEVLKTLDFVIVSVHSNFRMPAADMTARIVRAISSPYVTMLGHMTGRLLTKRKGYEVDEEAVFAAAKKNSVIIELNSNPYRMDIDYRHFARLREMGIMISINPDSHSIADAMPCVRFGVNAVNLGAMPESGVFNAKNAFEVEEFFKFKKETAGSKK